jgi:protein CpxP
MKKFALVCALVVGVCVSTFAQNGGGGGRMRMEPKAQVAALKEKITTISDDQAAKLLVVYTEVGKKRDSLMTAMRDSGGDRSTMRETWMKMQTATDTKVKAVLTADQAKEYQKIADERAAAMKARMQGN